MVAAERNTGRLMIAGAGIFWGTSGIFAQYLMQAGLSADWVSVIRLGFGCMVLTTLAIAKAPHLLRIDRKGLALAAGIGLISQAGFNLLYYNSIRMIGVAPAAVLLYTAPFFLLLWSVLFFGEKATPWKLAAVTLSFIGCAVAVTEGRLDALQGSSLGILLGVLSAVAYSIMSAASKRALTSYHPLTVIIYSFLFGTLFLLPYAGIHGSFSGQLTPALIGAAAGLGTIPSALSYWLYVGGIAKGVDLSEAGVISTLEMVCSVVLAWALFSEPLGTVRLAGIGLILGAIVMMNIPAKVSKAHSEVREMA